MIYSIGVAATASAAFRCQLTALGSWIPTTCARDVLPPIARHVAQRHL